MVKLWRCEICGDPYIGENPPDNCPFCGAHKQHMKEAKDVVANFDVTFTVLAMREVQTFIIHF